MNRVPLRVPLKSSARFFGTGAKNKISGLRTSTSSWWAAGCICFCSAVLKKSDKRNQEDPNNRLLSQKIKEEKMEKDEEKMMGNPSPPPVTHNGRGQPSSRQPRSSGVGFGRLQSFPVWVKFWCLLGVMWSLPHAHAFELSSWDETTGPPNGPPTVEARVVMQPWQRTRADPFYDRGVPSFELLYGVEVPINSSGPFDDHGSDVLQPCSLDNDAWQFHHVRSYMFGLAECKCSFLTSVLQEWAYPFFYDSMQVWAYPFSQRAVDDDDPLLLLLWLVGAGCLAWGWDVLCRVDDFLSLGTSLLGWFLDYLWGPLACLLLFRGFFSSRPTFPFSWVYPFSSSTSEYEALSHLGWLLALGLGGVLWDALCARELRQAKLAWRRRQRAAKRRRAKYRTRGPARLQALKDSARAWWPEPCARSASQARTVQRRRFAQVRGCRLLRPSLRRGPRFVTALVMTKRPLPIGSVIQPFVGPGAWATDRPDYAAWLGHVSSELQGGSKKRRRFGPQQGADSQSGDLASALASFLDQWAHKPKPSA